MQEIELVNEVKVTLVNASASDEMVAMAAWVSHDQDSEARLENKERLRNLIKFLYVNKHMSPFEHGLFTFKVDVPLFVAREWHRHRTASYNEVSGRYTEMKPRFYVGHTARVQQGKPGDYYFVDGTDDQTAKYLSSKRKALKIAWAEYQARLEAGIAKEQAREDLPLSLMTQFYFTVNPRNLMQFLNLRNEEHALKEIRDCAVQVEEIFAQHMPLTYKAYRSVRDAEKVDVESLQKTIQELKAELKKNEAEITKLKDKLSLAVAHKDTIIYERDAAIKSRDEAYEKYNGMIVTYNEKIKEEETKEDVQSPTDEYSVFINNYTIKSEEIIEEVLRRLRKGTVK